MRPCEPQRAAPYRVPASDDGLIAIAVAGEQIARIPEPVVGAVVISALLHSLDPRPLVRLWRLNKDQYVAVVAAVGVMILGVVDGMLVAVALSIAATLQRMSKPTIARLGELGESRNFVDVSYMLEAKTDPNRRKEPGEPGERQGTRALAGGHRDRDKLPPPTINL